MLLSNEVEFKMMLTPVKTGSNRFSDISHAIYNHTPENFKVSDYKCTEYGKYFHIEGMVDYHNEQKMIDEVKELLAGLIKELCRSLNKTIKKTKQHANKRKER